MLRSARVENDAKTILPEQNRQEWYLAAMEHLVGVVQQLSQAHDIDSIASIVREAARSLTGADGATFVLRDGDHCFYADENAIAPLWKGRRFPMSTCISGWVMLNAKPVMIEDIYADPRIPADAYRPTFVKSLAMVPIRRDSPVGAIGNYWATHRLPTAEELAILQALADTTSVAIENAQLYGTLKEKLRALEESNYELSRFAWVASHDLQEPLRTIATQVQLLERRYHDQLDERGIGYIHRAAQGANRLQELIEALLVHARVQKGEIRPVDLAQTLREVRESLSVSIREQKAEITCGEMPSVTGEPALLVQLFQNLISNAIKFHSLGAAPHIEITSRREGNEWLFCVRDDGIGIDAEYNEKIFGLFNRLNNRETYPGSGVGLATCKKIIELHRGRIWVESRPGEGSRFYFTLPITEGAS